MIKIDFDNFLERMDELRECLNDIPKPLRVRISGSGRGVHVISFHNDDKGYREKYDDPERLKLDRIREKFGLTNNILADVKCGKVAGKWITIKSETDNEYFIKEILNL